LWDTFSENAGHLHPKKPMERRFSGHGNNRNSGHEKVWYYGIETPEERWYDNIYAQATEYAIQKGVWLEIPDSTRCWWWLRSPGSSPQNATEAGSSGYLSFNGTGVDHTERAVRPVIRIRAEG